MISDLKALRNILNDSIDTIIDSCEGSGVEFPPLSEAVWSGSDPRRSPEVSEAVAKIVSASEQLTVTVQAPQLTLWNYSASFYLSACIGVAEAANIAEILREAGPNGMHIKDIAEKSGMHPKKLGVIMMLLVTKHIFREVSPDVFVNNAISSLLDSGKPHNIHLSAQSKLDSSQGMHSEIAFICDASQKGASHLRNVMTDPQLKLSEEPNRAALQRALNTDLNLFEYLDKPENAVVRKMFAKSMEGAVATQPAAAVLKAFDWDALKPGSLIVDVGGSLGHLSLEIAKSYPHLKFALEDLPGTARDALQYWKHNLPVAVEKNQVEFYGQSFFDPQPKFHKAADVFLLRFILHDWSDKYAIKILQNLRDAATFDTKLVIIDTIVGHTCASGQTSEKQESSLPPPPLLRNWGAANMLVQNVSAAVLTLFNAGERTKEGFEEIFAASGWKLQDIRWQSDPNIRPSLIAVPIQG